MGVAFIMKLKARLIRLRGRCRPYSTIPTYLQMSAGFSCRIGATVLFPLSMERLIANLMVPSLIQVTHLADVLTLVTPQIHSCSFKTVDSPTAIQTMDIRVVVSGSNTLMEPTGCL